jgi:hypothetical protein
MLQYSSYKNVKKLNTKSYRTGPKCCSYEGKALKHCTTDAGKDSIIGTIQNILFMKSVNDTAVKTQKINTYSSQNVSVMRVSFFKELM